MEINGTQYDGGIFLLGSLMFFQMQPEVNKWDAATEIISTVMHIYRFLLILITKVKQNNYNLFLTNWDISPVFVGPISALHIPQKLEEGMWRKPWKIPVTLKMPDNCEKRQKFSRNVCQPIKNCEQFLENFRINVLKFSIYSKNVRKFPETFPLSRQRVCTLAQQLEPTPPVFSFKCVIVFH